MARRGIFAVLESEGESDIDAIYGLTPYGTETIEADKAADDEAQEVEEQSGEIDDLLDETDEGMSDTETLQEIGGAIGDAADSGVGIDEVAIAPTIIATEALCKNLGMENFKIMPSLESFGSTNSRVQATKRASIAIEGVVTDSLGKIKQVLVRIWERVKAFVDKIVKMLKEFVIKRKLAMKKELAKLPDAKGEDFEDKSLIRAFGSPSGSDVNEKDMEKVLDAHMEIGAVLDHLATSGVTKDVLKDAMKDKRLVNGIHLKSEDDGKIEIKSDWEGGKVEGKKVVCLNKSEIDKTLTKLETMIRDSDKQSKAVSKIYKDATSKLKDTKEEGEKEVLKANQEAAKAVKELVNLNAKAIKAGLDYCRESIASIKKAAKGSKEEGGKKEDDK